MKLLKPWIAALLAFGFASMANAAPVQYHMSATYSDFHSPDNFAFADGTTVSATFSYDPSTPFTSAGSFDFNGSQLESSYYTGSLTQITGSLLNYGFSAASADTTALNCPLAFCGLQGTILSSAGNFAQPESAAYSSLQGFSIGDFSLVGLAIDTYYSNALIDRSLPASLIDPYPLFSHLELRFENSLGETRYSFFGGVITPVPLPGSLLFFMSGLIGLGANQFRKFKKPSQKN